MRKDTKFSLAQADAAVLATQSRARKLRKLAQNCFKWKQLIVARLSQLAAGEHPEDLNFPETNFVFFPYGEIWKRREQIGSSYACS